MTHTPGPWVINGKDKFWNEIRSSTGRLIVLIQKTAAYGKVRAREAKGNALLIAEAPELLEEGSKLANEVRGILALLESHVAEVGWTNIACLQRRLDNFDAVIANAEGEQ